MEIESCLALIDPLYKNKINYSDIIGFLSQYNVNISIKDK